MFQSQSTMPSPQTSVSKTPSCRPTKLERLRQTLVDLLPSQEDADLICEASSGWLLLHAFNLSKFGDDSENGKPSNPSNVNLAEVSEQHPTIIARTLLYISVCLQQMPPSFHSKLLHLPSSVESRVDRYISTVQTLITSDDELVSTIQGLECLAFLGAFHVNAGNPRRAWLAFRRAMGIAQLMGLDKANASIPGGPHMWHHIVHGDRYLALLLGLPCGSVDDVFGPEDTFDNPAADKDILFPRILSQISGTIIQRNLANNIQTFTATQEICEKLEQLAKDLPASWWNVPSYSLADRSRQTAEAFERLMMQIWYFQLEALLHLPFMLRPAAERRYEYSKYRCLKASREILCRYLALRHAEVEPFCCKIIDFGALIATVTLLLGLLELPQASESRGVIEQKERDRTLIRSVMTSMEKIEAVSSVMGGDIVAKQSVDVIKTLLSAESPAGPNGGNLRLTIPYFGTISIARPSLTPNPNEDSAFALMQAQQAAPIDRQAGMQDWQGLHFPPQYQAHPPVVSFTSSQFPSHVPDQQLEDWGLQETDTLFFDSLLNTDLEGNWRFTF